VGLWDALGQAVGPGVGAEKQIRTYDIMVANIGVAALLVRLSMVMNRASILHVKVRKARRQGGKAGPLPTFGWGAQKFCPYFQIWEISY